MSINSAGQMTSTTPADSPTGPLRIRSERSWRQRQGYRTVVWSSRVFLVVVVLVAWNLLSGPVLDPQFFGSPIGVAQRLVEWTGNGTLASNSWITIQEVVLGFLFGGVAGAVLAYLVAPVRVIWDVISPFVMALYAIPKVALAPLFIVWFGIGIDMKVILAAVSVFFLVFLNTAVGVQEVDRGLIDAVRLMGATRRDVAFKVTLPASMTGLLTGLKVAIPYAVIGAVIGELVASNRGLGYLISDSSARFDTNGVFAALVVLSILATILNSLVGVLSRRANRWKPLGIDH